MPRTTTKGLDEHTYISVARGHRRRDGTVIKVFTHAVHGTMVEYRALHNRAVYLAKLADVRIERAMERRRRAVAKAAKKPAA